MRVVKMDPNDLRLDGSPDVTDGEVSHVEYRHYQQDLFFYNRSVLTLEDSVWIEDRVGVIGLSLKCEGRWGGRVGVGLQDQVELSVQTRELIGLVQITSAERFETQRDDSPSC